MYKILLLIVISLSTTNLFAQQPKVVAQVTPAVPAKVVPVVPTKELKKQLERNFKRKKFKAVIPIADTLLKRNAKDENAFVKKVVSQVMLKMDKPAIETFKKWYKNKDTAATNISLVPYQFEFVKNKRSSDVYYKSAMAMAPKNGIPYLMLGADYADAAQPEEALKYVEKGYNLLASRYKKDYASLYGGVLHKAGKKAEAYKLLEDEIANGNNTEEVIREYFRCYLIDKRYEDGIAKATEFIKKDPQAIYYRRRGTFYNEMGNTEKACEDAVTLKDKYETGDFWQKEFNCAEVMAPVKPSMQRTYIYEVVFQGNTYDFRVTNPKVDMDKGVSFKYKMTGDVGINGVVNISKEAIDTAHVQMNRFSNGNKDLTQETSVWVSNAVFNELKTNGEAFMQASVFSAQVFQVVNEEDPFYIVKVDDQDKYIRCIHLVSKDGDDSQELWINDDPKNPIILKMKLDFSIELKQIL
jgi:tetratricopeptide (TPR) repeat protein